MESVSALEESHTMPITRHSHFAARIACALLGGLLLWSAAGLAKAPKGKGAKSGTQNASKAESASVDAVIDARQPDIRQCALEHAIQRGAKSVELSAKLLINNDGRVMGCQVTVKLDQGDKKPVSDCVDKVLRTVQFPRSTVSFRNALRNWKFAVQ